MEDANIQKGIKKEDEPFKKQNSSNDESEAVKVGEFILEKDQEKRQMKSIELGTQFKYLKI
jgi:hypothetical protein